MAEAEEVGRERFLTALKYPWLTPLYDPVIRWFFRERRIKGRLVDRAAIRPGERVLDVGCGTGTLAILLKKAQPHATVVGVDGDPAVLRMARRKALEAGAEVAWDHGMVQALPYWDVSFDVVVSSLVLHHLSHDDKTRALREAHRILRPGGSFHLVEFTRPSGALMKSLAKVSQLLEETEDGVEGRLLGMLRNAGFQDSQEVETFRTPLGTVALFHARKAA
ncbi:MAG TPA: class I SAM-dependent methyltransferase [Thermoplasmata archaeon]